MYITQPDEQGDILIYPFSDEKPTRSETWNYIVVYGNERDDVLLASIDRMETELTVTELRQLAAACERAAEILTERGKQ